METTERFSCTVTDKAGLHARPAANLAREVADFASEITVTFANHRANAKSMIAVMALGATTGSTIEFELIGGDAVTEASRLSAWCAENI